MKLIFVGRNQPRKKLERLIALAGRRADVKVRLIGPGMEKLDLPLQLSNTGKVEVFGKTMGNDLNRHFDWADLVASPGHVGLLVMNAARHGKGIVIDSESAHAPEYVLAEESNQPFIEFENESAIDAFLENVQQNRSKLNQWGSLLQSVAKHRYTVEKMSEEHLRVFDIVAR